MRSGWFRISGRQDGFRSLTEQMAGIGPALDSKGKTVLDLGCAEGLIALEFMRGGAVVHGVEFNRQLLEVALDLGVPAWYFDLNEGLPEGCFAQYDIVLLLAIVHKLLDPAQKLREFSRLARERVVIRLPLGSDGKFRSKYSEMPCDVQLIMPAEGFRLEQTLPGPRGELVQHWVRTNGVG
jgi:SAM-dependent methyltransferase